MEFDFIFQGGTVIDGTKQCKPFVADVGIKADKITAVGDLSGAKSGNTIKLRKQILSPGFIDVHVHSEMSILNGRDQLAGVSQGVTTQFLAPDGFGWACLDPQRSREMWHYTQFCYGETNASLDWKTAQDYIDIFPGKIPLNVCSQVPHCAIRLAVMGWEGRVATNQEIKAMKQYTIEWMEAGAVGICLGLDYQPSANADLSELVELCKVVSDYGGIYAAHVRYAILGRKKAWEETLELSRRSGIPVHISHERVDEVSIDILNQAERDGIDLTFESYLYPAGMTHFTMQLPMEIQVGSPQEVLAKLSHQNVRSKSISHLQKNGMTGHEVIGYTKSGRYIGMTLTSAANDVGKTIEEFAYDLIIEEDGVETLIFPWPTPHQENEEILNQTAAHPKMMIASDGIYEVPHPHPRGYGCFAQVLRKFVRERKIIPLEEAIWKMSGFPAERFGLTDRGQIAEGFSADLVVLDPETVADLATWGNPIQTAVGIDYVMVNGELVISGAEATGKLPGRLLRR